MVGFYLRNSTYIEKIISDGKINLNELNNLAHTSRMAEKLFTTLAMHINRQHINSNLLFRIKESKYLCAS